MILFSRKLLSQYKRNDVVLKFLLQMQDKNDLNFASHRWLLESPSKRLIFHQMYGDLLSSKKKKILDVGGGYSSITKQLVQDHKYKLIDIMSHDDHKSLRKIETRLGTNFWEKRDWYDVKGKEKYDLVVANDIFPNVDQRLTEFIKKYSTLSKEIRISLTFYNKPKFYKVKRVDAEEIFFIVPWNGEQLLNVLSRFKKNITDFRDALFKSDESIFENKRVVLMINMVY